ncbi:hypothetical protein [Paenibacillus sp. JCM 10914]
MSSGWASNRSNVIWLGRYGHASCNGLMELELAFNHPLAGSERVLSRDGRTEEVNHLAFKYMGF